MNTTYKYEVKLPEKIESGKKYPVIFALHGIGYDEKYMLSLLEELKEEYILIGIQGDLPYENGYAYYYLKNYGNPERELFDSSMEKLKNFIEEASNHYPIDPDRKYLIGFSQGAILSMSLALILGEFNQGNHSDEWIYPTICKRRVSVKVYRSFVSLSLSRCNRSNLPITYWTGKL